MRNSSQNLSSSVEIFKNFPASALSMTNQAAIIFININSRSSTQIIMTSVAAGEALKAARCVYGAAVTDDGPMLCFNHQH